MHISVSIESDHLESGSKKKATLSKIACVESGDRIKRVKRRYKKYN